MKRIVISAEEFRKKFGTKKSKAGKYVPQILLPSRNITDLFRVYSDGSVEICLPLTPSQNDWRHWHWKKCRRFRRECLSYAEAIKIVSKVKGPIGDPVILSITRCSNATVRADHQNVHGGCKEATDVLLMPKWRRPGIGWIVDDDPSHILLGRVLDKPMGHWGDTPGPGTWFRIEPLRKK